MKKIFTTTEIPTLVKNDLVPRLSQYKIFTFSGPLGAGKTTIIKELLKQCGVTTTVTSPTFTYLNIYQDSFKKHTFYHFDLYRLTTAESFIDAGFDEYLYMPNSKILIEWPEVIKPLLATTQNVSPLCQITLNFAPNNPTFRHIEIIP